QPSDNITRVRVAMATNEVTRSNLVSYADGDLIYHPGKSAGPLFLPPYFASDQDSIIQYFSDRRYQKEGGFDTCTFDCSNTDPINITINRPFVVTEAYTITLKSTKWGFELGFEPSFDSATGIVYGSLGSSFITLSFCNRRSERPPG